MGGRTRRIALAGALLTGVGCSGDGSSDPSPRIDQLYLSVATEESEQDRELMVIGEVGSAHVTASRNSLGTDPGRVSFSSSSPAVVAIQPTGPVNAGVVAVAPGSVQIVADAQGQTDRVQVDVTDAPLPVDPIHVRLAPISSDVEAAYDADGNLTSLKLAVGESAALDLKVTRNGTPVTRIPFLLVSSEPSAARVDEHCRIPELDPQCSVFGTWGWVTGVQVGQSVVSVTVRNQATSFIANIE